MSRSKRGSLGVVSAAVCAALVVVGLGFAGTVTQMNASATATPSQGRDYTLNTQGSGALILKRDGQLSQQGSGQSQYIDRSGTLAAGGDGVQPGDGVIAVATLHRGPGRIDFDPAVDGFGFANYGIGTGQRTDVLGIDSDSARAVLGDQVVCKSQVGPCEPTTRAKRWISRSNKLALGGQCFGMAASALLGFHGKQSAGFSGPAGSQSLEGQPQLQRSIATWQASQDTVELENARRTVTANQATAALVDSFTKSPAEQFMLTVANRDPKTGSRVQGHALVPFGVFRDDGGVRYIATYDPNVPGAATAIKVNSDSDSWTYSLGGVTYDGKGDLELIPATALETQPLHPDPDKDSLESTDN